MNSPDVRTMRRSVPLTFITRTSDTPLPLSRCRVTSSVSPSGDQWTAIGPIDQFDAIGVGGVRSTKRSMSERTLAMSEASVTTTRL